MLGKSNKKQIELQVFGKGLEAKYTGRLLGLLSDKEYDALFVKPELKDKMSTVETVSLNVIGKMEDVAGLRLAMTVRTKNEEEVLPRKVLFISEPLEHVSSYRSSAEVTFVSPDSYFIAKEVDV